MKRFRGIYIIVLSFILVTILVGCSGVNDNISSGKSREPVKIDVKDVKEIVIESAPHEPESKQVKLKEQEIIRIVNAFNSGKDFRNRDWGTTEQFRITIILSDDKVVMVKDARIDPTEGTVMVDVVSEGVSDSMSMKSKELLEAIYSYKDKF